MDLNLQSSAKDLANWIRKDRELHQYAEVFEDDNIDGEALSLISEYEDGNILGIDNKKHWEKIKKKGEDLFWSQEREILLTFQSDRIGISYSGNKITRIAKESNAEKQGIRVGWIIEEINDQVQPSNNKIISHAIKEASASGQPMTILFKQKKMTRFERLQEKVRILQQECVQSRSFEVYDKNSTNFGNMVTQQEAYKCLHDELISLKKEMEWEKQKLPEIPRLNNERETKKFEWLKVGKKTPVWTQSDGLKYEEEPLVQGQTILGYKYADWVKHEKGWSPDQYIHALKTHPLQRRSEIWHKSWMGPSLGFNSWEIESEQFMKNISNPDFEVFIHIIMKGLQVGSVFGLVTGSLYTYFTKKPMFPLICTYTTIGCGTLMIPIASYAIRSAKDEFNYDRAYRLRTNNHQRLLDRYSANSAIFCTCVTGLGVIVFRQKRNWFQFVSHGPSFGIAVGTLLCGGYFTIKKLSTAAEK